MREEKGLLVWRRIPGLERDFSEATIGEEQWRGKCRGGGFACVSMVEKREKRDFLPSTDQFLKHPLALLAFVPKDAALFAAGAIAGAAAKSVTAPLDRIKLLMQTHGLRVGEGSAKKAIGFIEAISLIGKEEGLKGYWKGNLPQVIRIIPYSAVQLFAYEAYKKLLRGDDGELSVIGRLAAGACAGMTSTLVTYPLDVLRLRLAVEPGCRTMSQVALSMLRDEGIASFYKGLGPSLIGIAPYIAVNFCIFDLVKKALPEKYQRRTETSLATALMSATLATLMCYPLDTVRRQMQMRGSPYKTVLDAFPGIVARDGVIGLYRGFLPNALKNLPNSSIRLTTFDTVKGLIAASQKELERIVDENREKQSQDIHRS
ncbi:Mitochondrial carrier protein [Macleaya cordata]|uniref:Mitochondrial carrier protein n=1 Tax=Macleaya cordata TaxID=56857 RepID=A0A200PWZ1_MACCD|nr:Mitochondrial carrier protein [Macleaya cordata]